MSGNVWHVSINRLHDTTIFQPQPGVVLPETDQLARNDSRDARDASLVDLTRPLGFSNRSPPSRPCRGSASHCPRTLAATDWAGGKPAARRAMTLPVVYACPKQVQDRGRSGSASGGK